MPTIEDAHKQRWQAVRSDIPYNPDAAFVKYFKEHAEIGSPIKPEFPLSDGAAAQAFTGGVLRWSPGTGVEVIKG